MALDREKGFSWYSSMRDCKTEAGVLSDLGIEKSFKVE
jgi:hypothetical protein